MFSFIGNTLIIREVDFTFVDGPLFLCLIGDVFDSMDRIELFDFKAVMLHSF